ncbi:hypothetical protein ACOSQ2_027623 [Xanthoceras sorbifolium]
MCVYMCACWCVNFVMWVSLICGYMTGFWIWGAMFSVEFWILFVKVVTAYRWCVNMVLVLFSFDAGFQMFRVLFLPPEMELCVCALRWCSESLHFVFKRVISIPL